MPPNKTTTHMSAATIKALVARSVADALAEHEANRSRNGDENHNSRSGERRQELALMCGRMFPEETDQVKKYVGGLVDMIQGSVMASKPKTMQEAIKIPNDLMDQKVRTFAERQAENKRKLDNNSNDNNTQQPPKKQNVARAYSAWPSEKKEYIRTLSLCNNYKFHNNGSCTVKCANFNIVGHYKSDCPKLKNQNHENQVGGTEACGMVYSLGGGETDQDLNNMEDDINA
uniref:Reverse transcriptase domain-containing protein n=1 Tax=Tanacetum cinerariifolium TaxID=118510 RepID=A0A6L2NYS3_TANCI|nr:reverse transcriptase domain-containing protein [Tanacetum cinerariifolium]